MYIPLQHGDQTEGSRVGDWDTKESTYAEDKFYTTSTDGKGHQKHLRVNLPPGLMARMQQLANAEELPQYRTVQDVARDALHHRVRWVEKNVDSLDIDHDQTAILRMKKRIEYLRTEGETLQELVETLEEALELHYERENRKLLWETISEARQHLDAVQPPYYQKVKGLVKEYMVKARELEE